MRGRIDPLVLERFGTLPEQVIIKRLGQVGAEIPGWTASGMTAETDTFYPGQPRDERGRWTKGPGVAASLGEWVWDGIMDPDVTTEECRDRLMGSDAGLALIVAADHWGDGMNVPGISYTADELLRGKKVTQPEYVPDAKALLSAIHTSPGFERALYRGNGATKGEMRGFKVGDTVDIPLASFSTSSDTAYDYAASIEYEDESPVMFAVEAYTPIKAVPIYNILAVGDWEEEVLTGGRFRVTNIEEESFSGGGLAPPDSILTVVTMEQVKSL